MESRIATLPAPNSNQDKVLKIFLAHEGEGLKIRGICREVNSGRSDVKEWVTERQVVNAVNLLIRRGFRIKKIQTLPGSIRREHSFTLVDTGNIATSTQTQNPTSWLVGGSFEDEEEALRFVEALKQVVARSIEIIAR